MYSQPILGPITMMTAGSIVEETIAVHPSVYEDDFDSGVVNTTGID